MDNYSSNKKTYWICGVFLLVLIFLLLFFPISQKQDLVLVSNNEHNYKNVLISHLKNKEVIICPNNSTLSAIKLGNSATVYDFQATPFLEYDSNYTFLPQIAHTVIIAVDRDMTDEKIESFEDLLHTKNHITFDLGDRFEQNDWGSPKAQHIILSMAQAIYGTYDVESVSKFMGDLWADGDRFHYQDMWQPILVTYDSTAAAYMKDGRNLEIIVPTDGTITLNYGLLTYNNSLDYIPEMEKELIESGYRLPNGTANPYLSTVDYRNAQLLNDANEYRRTTTTMGATVRRNTFEGDTFNFANIVEFTIGILISTFLLIFYLFSILKRVTNKQISYAIAVATILALLFLIIGFLKYLINDHPFIETILWYSFYIPMYGMSAILIYVMTRAEEMVRPTSVKRTAKWYKRYLCITSIILITIFTNHLHQWIFIVSDYQYSYHTYNWGYFFVLAWIYFSVFIALGSLIKQCIHSPRKKMFLCPIAMVAVMLFYSYGHIYNVSFIINFEISFAIAIIGVLFTELCMISRIFPHNIKYRPLFLHSALAMELVDYGGNIMEQSHVSKTLDENFILRQWKISGGSFFYYEDLTTLNNTKKNLRDVNELRRNNNQLLLQKSRLQADLAALAVQRRIYESIDQILLEGTVKIEELATNIIETQDNKRTMTTINILACMMKRSCMFRINMLYQHSLQVSLFSASLSELIGECASIGLTLTIGCRITKELRYTQVVAMYIFYAAAIEQGIAHRCFNIIIQLYEQNEQLTFSILGNIPLFTRKELKRFSTELSSYGIVLTKKNWEDTEAYILVDDKEESL